MFVQNSSLVTYIENVIVDYIDLDFTLWLTWLLTPLLITFLLPLIIVLLLYVTALTFYIYKLHRHRLRHAYDTDFWDGARKTASAVWDAHGWIWHGSNLFNTSNYWRHISKTVNTFLSIKHLQFSVLTHYHHLTGSAWINIYCQI